MASDSLKPAYLIAGTDEAKIGAALARLRGRAEREGGPGALQAFEPAPGGAPDASALIAAIPAMSLTARAPLSARRRRGAVAGARPARSRRRSMGSARTPDSRPRRPRKAARGASEAVEKAGGELLAYDAPRRPRPPGAWSPTRLGRGFRLEPAAARMLVERLGSSTVRLATELDRLALWAGADGQVTSTISRR